jgi:hypothetical protein
LPASLVCNPGVQLQFYPVLQLILLPNRIPFFKVATAYPNYITVDPDTRSSISLTLLLVSAISTPLSNTFLIFGYT